MDFIVLYVIMKIINFLIQKHQKLFIQKNFAETSLKTLFLHWSFSMLILINIWIWWQNFYFLVIIKEIIWRMFLIQRNLYLFQMKQLFHKWKIVNWKETLKIGSLIVNLFVHILRSIVLKISLNLIWANSKHTANF